MSSLFKPSGFRGLALEALLLCVLAAGFGLILNYSMVRNAFTGQLVIADVDKRSPVEEQRNGVVAGDDEPFPVVLEEIGDFLADGALLIDARDRVEYVKSHLAGARSLPLGQFEQLIADFKNSVPLDRTLILYCSGYGCPDSSTVGRWLIREGYGDVLTYEGGYPEWRDRGRALEGGQ